MAEAPRVGKYELLDLLGKGGMGEVWRARDVELDREECDDFPGMGTNSRFDVTFPADGTYTVAATSYAAGATGAYVLRVWLRDEESERR